MAGYRIVHQRAAAFVRNVLEIEPIGLAQQRHGQVSQAARADRAITGALGGTGRGHHISQRFELRTGRGAEHHGRGAHQHHRAQVFFGVERQVRDQAGVDAMAVKHHGEGVTIRRRRRHGRRADRARSAALVFHNH